MEAFIEISIVVSVVIIITVPIRFVIVRIAKSKNLSLLSWVTSAVMGSLWLFFIVFAQIKAAEAEKQVNAVLKEVQKSTEVAMEAQAIAEANAEEAHRQAQIAEEVIAKLEDCK